MPGLVRSGRKRPSPEESEDSSDSDLPTPVSVNGKRARYGRDASDSSPAPSNGNHNRQHTQNLSANGAYNEDVFQSGSIVRVKLKNFVTYTAAEFHLGPSLNMIIGPNGTGKSTLVCAICLGLGWSSEHLGRAKELSAFVKHGADEAEIEIELAKAEGMRANPVVTRILRRADNKTVFLLNGKHSTKNAVMEMCKRFSIQIDNLCQFLPQDRVVEFAKMKDTERLRATLGAAAPPEMSEWHDQLKVLREEEKVLEVKRHNDEEHLKKLEALQNTTRGDVERWNQRQELASKTVALEKVRPIIQLRLHKQEFERVKANWEAAKQELTQLHEEVEPIRQAGAAAQTYHDQVNQVVQRRRQMMDMIKKQAEKKAQAISAENKTIEEHQGQITSEMRDKQGRQQDIARLTKKNADLERKRQEQPVDYDREAYQQRKEELRQEMSSAERRILDLRGTMSSIQARIQDFRAQRTAVKQQRERLDTQSGKQTSLLQKISPETAKAWEWFEMNKAQLPLKGEVHGPPILTCSLTDPKYADAVESQMRLGDAVAITCTNNDDQRLLLREMTHKDKLGLHGIYLRTSPKPLSAYSPPVPNSDLSQYGFEGYLRDYITGPDPVIAMLCDNVRLNRVAFVTKAITDQQHAAASSSPIQAWVSGREAYRITTRREYGVSSTSVNHLKRGQFFVDQPINSDEKLQLDEQLRNMDREGYEMKTEHDEAKAEVQKLMEEVKAVKEQRDEIVREEKERKKAIAEWEALPRMIDQNKAELQQHLDLNAQTSNRIREIKAQSRQCSLKIASLTLEYAKYVTEFRRLHENVVEAEIRLIEAASEVRALEKENKLVLERLRSRETQVKQLEQAKNTMKEEIRREHRATQALVNSCTEEEHEIVVSYKDLESVAALDDEIQSVNARLEMMSAGDGSVVKTYENREVQIGKTRDSLEKHVAALEEAQSKIAEIKGPFVEQLDELIEKISAAFAHNFEQIGCAGEVSVYKDEDDFNAWSIQISVRFREGESMSVLNANRQSGGERAVSTIFYLMALQDLAQAPFRVVDEINQGMDPRNERMVHERMVDIACQERTSQYFLITPKLLSGLKFHSKMKVHVINSGEHVPKSTTSKDEWNLKDMAKVALAVRGRVSAAA
ncbi:structural maintenance of chromosomes protein-like protein 5 [Macroventuria anomochaeta]|uniref:Structural maintenance of chromosomes protein-like protein 5 n=1 Tax=Macroventuria anomochaeta TaxID=301207 RepID=A0ACB6RN73_9PLEO|nr:structural maintenance of chromosomes protein-like protein 5 [Macroventuria anomochaeta]KAF2622604.1 structural maintenance of chromosomes protein-like protein 5 [Macroventuria anomochaeta]